MNRRFPLLAGMVVVLSVGWSGQEKAVVIAPEEIWEHRTGLQSSIHARNAESFEQRVMLEVTVATDGSVEVAKATAGPQELFEKAEGIELKRRFKPFLRDGEAVRASFTDEVQIVPPEQWAENKIPFPQVKNVGSVRIVLKRTMCFGSCPDYTVEILGSGEVKFEGRTSTLITGHHRGEVSQQSVGKLLAQFKQADYFSLKNGYSAMITDNPTYTTSIEFDGHKKTVVDYVGSHAGMPEIVGQLEASIDEIAGTEKWIKETSETGPALLAEHWDFKADTEENRTLFANVVDRGSPELIRLFTEHGAPALQLNARHEGALVAAAKRGNTQLMKQMIGKQEKLPSPLLSCALVAAAGSGSLEAVKLLLDKGADVNGPICDSKNNMTPLLSAASSGKADVIEELLSHHADANAQSTYRGGALSLFLERGEKSSDSARVIEILVSAGVNVNALDQGGRTAIFSACNRPEAVEPLAQAGADLNVRDRNGETALMACFDPAYLKALIKAGADLSIRSRNGRTAAEEATAMGATDKAALLEVAEKKPN